jgi:hypothetical protein
MDKKAIAYVYRHSTTGRLIIDLHINGSHYGDYPIDGCEVESQLRMVVADAADYSIDEVVLKIGKPQ